jgi:WD40 repeat protein
MRSFFSAGCIRRPAKRLGIVGACFVLSAPLSAEEIIPRTIPRATLEGHNGPVESLSFSPDGKTLASGSDDKSSKLWDMVTGKNSVTLKEKDPYYWCSVAFSPDGKTLATGGWFNKVKLWNIGACKGTTLLDEHMQCPPTLVVFSPDGKTLASGGKCRGGMKLFDVATSKSTTLITQEGFNPWGVEAMAFTPDGKILASISHHRGIAQWDVATGREITVALKPADKERIKKLIGNLGNANFFEREKASKDLEVMGPLALDMLKQACDHPDAEISSRAARLVDLLVARTVTAKLRVPAVFSPDCKTLAAATSDNGVKLWEVATGKEQASLKGDATGAKSLAFCPDGTILAAGTEDGMIKLWDVSTRKELAAFRGHLKSVCSLAFSPDGKSLASGGEDKTIKLWDVTR